MIGWKKNKLEDITLNITDGKHGDCEPQEGSGYYFLSAKDILDGKLNFDNAREITKEEFTETHKRTKLEVGDVLITNSGTIGRMAVVCEGVREKRTTFQKSVAILKPKKDTVDPYFLYYHLLAKKREIVNTAGGTTQQNLLLKDIRSFEIVIPEDIKEQKLLASILSSLDDKIELNLQMNKTLEAIVQAIFKEWFMDFRFPGFDGELIDGLPKGWRIGKLNQVAKVEIGRTPPRMENQWFSTNNGDVKWISIRDLGNSGIYILDTSEYLTSAAIEKFRIPIILSNTVVLSFKLTIGRVAITTEKMLSNEAIAQIRSDTFDSGFIYCLLKNYNFDSLGSTSSIATAINSKIIREMEVQVPEQKVVCDFCKVIEPLFAKIKSNSLEIKTLTKIREVLLPKLMTGKIRVA